MAGRGPSTKKRPPWDTADAHPVTPLIVVALLVASLPAGAGAMDLPPGWDQTTSTATYNAKIDDYAGGATIAGMQDAGGTVLFRAFTSGNTLYLTDGLDEEGRERTVTATPIGFSWNQVALGLHGDTYTFTLNQAQAWTLQANTHATEGTLFFRDDGSGLHLDRLRYTLPSETRNNIFTTSLTDRGWGSHEDGGTARTVTDLVGFVGGKSLRVEGSDGAGEVAFAHVPTTGLGDAYTVRSVVSVPSKGCTIRPDHVAAVAGMTGDQGLGEVTWAVTVGPFGTLSGWALYVVTSDGIVDRVSERVSQSGWAQVIVSVDETAGTLRVQLGDGPPQEVTGLSLGSSDRLVFGDIWAQEATTLSPCLDDRLDTLGLGDAPTGRGDVRIDDVILTA